MTQHNKREPVILPDVLELHEMLTRRQNGEDLQNEAGLLELVERDFQEADLSGLDLSYCDFSGSNFTCTNLTGTRLDESQLFGSLFIGARLTGASLVHVLAPITNFSGARCQHMKATSGQFTGAMFVGANLYGADFQCSDLSTSTFASFYTDARCVNFASACLHDADLSGVQLEQSSFHGAQLFWTKFDGSTITERELRGAVHKQIAIE